MKNSLRRFVVLLAAMTVCLAATVSLRAESLVERLGFDKNARLLITNADDFGMCHSANVGTFKALSSGGITSATVMTPCPWFTEAARWSKENPRASVGVHLTLTNEWGVYNWGPVLGWKTVPGLCSENGYLVKSEMMLYTGENLDQAEIECRAQIERALAAGWDVTHLDCHMGCLQYDPRYVAVYLKLAKEFNFPCRMPGKDDFVQRMRVGAKAGHPRLSKLSEEGLEEFIKAYTDIMDEFPKNNILTPDLLILDGPKNVEATERHWKNVMKNQPAGTVMELYIHCADDSDEMKQFSGSQRQRYAETEFFADPATLQWIADQGIILISYRELRELQRTGKTLPRVEYAPWK